MSEINDLGCCFESSDIVASIDDMSSEIKKEIKKIHVVTEDIWGEVNLQLLYGCLRGIDERLGQQTKLLKQLVEQGSAERRQNQYTI